MKGTATIVALGMLTVMLAGCAGNDKDTDGDGVPDRIEERGWESYILGSTRTIEVTYTSDPTKADTDGDGLSDWDETFVRGSTGKPILDPRNVDTDGDGLTDCQEWYVQVGASRCPIPDGFQEYDLRAYQTEAHAVDSDISGGPSRYMNFWINNGTGYVDELGFDSSNGWFTRGDGLSDSEEIFGYDIRRPDGTVAHGVTSDPFLVDSDDDGLEDGEEALRFGSDPHSVDSDGDGCDDARDIFPATPDTYRIQLHEFTLGEGPAADGSADLMLVSGLLVNTLDDFQYHPASGHVDVAQGEKVSLAELTGEFRGRSDCGPDAKPLERVASATNPWVLVQVVPYHKKIGSVSDNRDAYSDGALVGLDVVSGTIPEEAFKDGRIYWNPQVDVYRWSLPDVPNAWRYEDDPDAFELDGPFIHLEGDDGEIWFRPEVQGPLDR